MYYDEKNTTEKTDVYDYLFLENTCLWVGHVQERVSAYKVAWFLCLGKEFYFQNIRTILKFKNIQILFKKKKRINHVLSGKEVLRC